MDCVGNEIVLVMSGSAYNSVFTAQSNRGLYAPGLFLESFITVYYPSVTRPGCHTGDLLLSQGSTIMCFRF